VEVNSNKLSGVWSSPQGLANKNGELRIFFMGFVSFGKSGLWREEIGNRVCCGVGKVDFLKNCMLKCEIGKI
jgi:hypothetical protein